MTSRERLFAALKGEPTDRVPVWLLFPYHKTGYYVDVRTNPCYVPVFEESRRTAVMLDRRNLGMPLWVPEVAVSNAAFTENGWDVKRTTLRCGDDELFSETRRSDGETLVRKMLTTDADLETLLRFPVETDRRRIEAHLDGILLAYRREQSEFPADYGSMMLDQGEPIGALYAMADLESLAIWSLTHSDAVVRFLERVMLQKRIVYEYCLERDLADIYFLVGSEMAAPPFVSLATFRRWIMPYATELIGRIHARGKFVIQHFHGHIREVLPEFLPMGPDGLHTIEAPPVGNCTFAQAYDVVGDRITLIGNIQYDCFRSYSPARMAQAVREVLDECRGRRFILSPTAGPYEETIPASMTENYLTFLKAAWEHGKI